MILQNYECHKKATNQQPLLRYLGQKQSTMHDPCTQQHHGVGRPAGPSLLSNHKPPLPSLHVRNQPALLREQVRAPVTFFHFVMHCESQNLVVVLFRSHQFLLIVESKDCVGNTLNQRPKVVSASS